MFAARLRYSLLAIVLTFVGCAGGTGAVNSVINSNTINNKPTVIRTGSSGTLREFPVVTNDNFLRSIALGSDGDIWFGAAPASGSIELGRIGLTGKASYFPTENGNGTITGIANGPEGDVWFTSASDTWKIGKMTTRGKVVFNETLPGGYASQGGLAVGSDGDVWFPLDGPGPAIGKSNRNGVVTIYPFPTAYNGISGVARGADGNIWFTYFYPFGVAKIAPNGTITDYPAPSNEDLEAHPVLGHDGRIWFSVQNETTRSTTYQIGAINTSGSMVFYALPSQQPYGVNGLTLGPDGRVWYSQYDSIGSVDTSGGFSKVLTAPPTSPLGGEGEFQTTDEVELLTTDTSGDVWFAQNVNRLGAIKP